jgi:hypothetical protein
MKKVILMSLILLVGCSKPDLPIFLIVMKIPYQMVK